MSAQIWCRIGANRRCDCDGYRPDTLGGGIWCNLFLLPVVLGLQRGAARISAVP